MISGVSRETAGGFHNDLSLLMKSRSSTSWEILLPFKGEIFAEHVLFVSERISLARLPRQAQPKL
jgi:hypothetical protein